MARVGPAYGNAILNFIFRMVAPTAPTGLRMSFHTADPTTVGDHEVTDTGYARVDIGSPLAFGVAASANSIANTLQIIQAAAAAGAYTITHFGVWDQAGVYMIGGTVTPNVAVAAGNIPEIPIGSAVINIG